jgi:hypothetical protein
MSGAACGLPSHCRDNFFLLFVAVRVPTPYISAAFRDTRSVDFLCRDSIFPLIVA